MCFDRWVVVVLLAHDLKFSDLTQMANSVTVSTVALRGPLLLQRLVSTPST